MTSTFYSQLGIIISILALLVPSWQIIIRPHTKRHKRVTPLGWVLFGVAILFGFTSYFALDATKKEQVQAQKDADSIRKADRDTIIKSVQDALKEHNLTYDTATKTIKPDTVYITENQPQKTDEKPVIALMSIDANPTVTTNNGQPDGLCNYSFILKNYGHGNIRNLIDTFVLYEIININDENSSVISIVTGSSGNPNSIMPENTNIKLTYQGGHDLRNGQIRYLYLKLDYQNNEFEKQPTIRNLYYSGSKYLNQSLPEVNATDYHKIENILKRYNAW